jgi:hypothetical protein
MKWFFCLLLCFCAAPVFAQTAEEIAVELGVDPPEPEDRPTCERALTLRYGDTLQCTEGVLLPPKWASTCTKQRMVIIPGLQNDLTFMQKTLQAEIDLLRVELKTEKLFAKEQSRLLDKALESIGPEPWWRHSGIWIGLGLVVGTGTTIAITYAVNDGGR